MRRQVCGIVEVRFSAGALSSIQVGRIWGIVARPGVDSIFSAANRLFTVGLGE